jgi:hypothetical protein
MVSTPKPTIEFGPLLSALSDDLRSSMANLIERPQDFLSSLASAPEPAPKPLPLSPAVFTAAINDTFTLGELAIDDNERNALLENCESVMFGGERRLRLLQRPRAEILQNAKGSKAYQTQLDAAYLADMVDFDAITNDDLRRQSAWLRCFLKGENGNLYRAPVTELRSAVAAREALDLVELPDGVPTLAEARRLMDRAELLEPLRVLIGARGGWDGTPAKDRFVGRVAEIGTLRAFVDELNSESIAEAAGRAASRVLAAASQTFFGRGTGVLILSAQGGLGKSSLIAKFVLDHALSQIEPFPFVYLDFDRAGLQPREPRQLLIEASRQVALQFPQIRGDIDALEQKLRQAISGAVSTADARPMTLAEAAKQFCDLMRTQVTGGRRAFLLTLDTMEVVQSDQRALQGVVSLVDALFEAGLLELKVVAAGRADIPEFRSAKGPRPAGAFRELDALTIGEAEVMANVLGTDLLGTKQWNAVWAKRIAGTPADSKTRREPLTVRVAVEFIRSASDYEQREKASQQIEKDGENVIIESPDGTTIKAPFVASLYLRRVLDHVRDEEARKLAWPGLLLRRITRDMIDQFLGALCKLQPGNTERVFEALRREVWIVEPDGDGLRHRPDLRARTLPLMRQHDRKLFDEINQAAIAYFAPRAQSDGGARAEWIYHRLLGGEDGASVDRDWTEDVATLLVDATDDFKYIVPRSAQYILTKTALRLLPTPQLQSLPPDLVLEHIARTAPHLGEFTETMTEPALLVVSRWPVVTRRKLSDIGAAAQTVIDIKLGRWEDGEDDAGSLAEPWATLVAYAIKFRQVRMLSVEGASDVAEDLQDAYSRDSNAKTGPELDFRVLAQDMAAARILDLPIAPALDQRLAYALLEMNQTRKVDFGALVTAIVFGGTARDPAIRAWLRARGNYSGLDAADTVSRSQILALTQQFPKLVSEIKDLTAPALKRLGLSWSEFAAQKDPDGALAPLRILDRELSDAIVRAIGMVSETGTPGNMWELARYFAARDADWILPFGYAAARLFDGAIPESVARRLRSYSQLPAAELPTDFLQIMRRADEASDLAGMAGLIASEADLRSEAARDFRLLRNCHADWRVKIEKLCKFNDISTVSIVKRQRERPMPGPIVNSDDPQKGRWGGLAERGGRSLTANLTEVKQRYYFVDFVVRSIDGSPLVGPIVFHLHDSYPRSIIHIRKIRDASWATLEEVSSYGVCTVGVQVKDANANWIGLEFDLATLSDLPRRFLKR